MSLKGDAERTGDASVGGGFARLFAEGDRLLRGDDGSGMGVVSDFAGDKSGRICAGAEMGIVLEEFGFQQRFQIRREIGEFPMRTCLYLYGGTRKACQGRQPSLEEDLFLGGTE